MVSLTSKSKGTVNLRRERAAAGGKVSNWHTILAISFERESDENVVVRCPWATREPDDRLPRYGMGRARACEDRMLFELLTMEGAQAGLSWDTILKKRAGYRAAFADFDPRARREIHGSPHRKTRPRSGYCPASRQDRSHGAATPKHFWPCKKRHGSFATYLWSFVDGHPVVTRRSIGEPSAGEQRSFPTA